MQNKILILFLSLVLILTSCTNSVNEEIKLGVVAPLSGPNAWIGEFVIPSVQLAVDDINSKGGKQIKLIIEDADTSAKATTSANKLISQDGVNLIYSVTTPVTAAASAVAEQNKVPLFGFTAVQTFAKKNTWVFSDLRDVIQECSLLSQTALKESDMKLAYLGNDADFSVECLETLQKEFVAKGGELVISEVKNSGDHDARTALIKIKETNPDALVLMCWPPDCNLIYRQMVELNFMPQLYLPVGVPLGANAASVKDLDKNKILKDAFAGDQGIDMEDRTPEIKTFYDRLNAKIGKDIPYPDAVIAYDNIFEIAQALDKCSSELTNECLRDKLSQVDYTGASGHIKFEGKHYAVRSAKVVKFVDSKWVDY